MKQTILMVTMLLLVVAVIPAAAAPPSPFTGHWVATDEDLSNLSLTIGGNPGGVVQVHLFDDRATAGCPITQGVAFAHATGEIFGDTLSVEGSFTCPSERITGDFAEDFVDNLDGTLSSETDLGNPILWTRR